MATRSTDPKLSAAAAARPLGAPRRGRRATPSPGHVVSTKDLPGATDTSVFNTGNRASLVDFPTADNACTSPGWRTRTRARRPPTSTSSTRPPAKSSSARTRRRSTPAQTGKAWQYYPSSLLAAGVGNDRAPSASRSTTPGDLSGNNAHTYADPLDSIQVPGGTVPSGDRDPEQSSSANMWNYTAQLDDGVNGPWMGTSVDHFYGFANCDPHWKCTWADDVANSWQLNRNQNGTQVYYYLNNFHDWLKNHVNIGFGPAQGNFQVSNGGQGGLGTMPSRREIDDGASTSTSTGGSTSNGGGYPDPNHTDNANMATPPDGFSPRMQMYLFGRPRSRTADGPDSPTAARTSRHRLPRVHARALEPARRRRGGKLDARQRAGGRDGRGVERLVRVRLSRRRRSTLPIRRPPASSFIGAYSRTAARPDPHRADRLRGRRRPGTVCPGGAPGQPAATRTATSARSSAAPEVHADGEIWAQTLWDLRRHSAPASPSR